MAQLPVSMETRFALNDALQRYLTEIDALNNLDAIVDTFTPDATLDLSGLLLPVFKGHKEIRGFYSQVFADMSHHMHTMTNFRVRSYEGDKANAHAYVCGMGRSHKGIDIQVYVYYDIDFALKDGVWRICRFYEAPQLPMPDSVTAVHAR